jgi:hypothetical protein
VLMSSFLCPYIKEAEKGASLFGEKGDETVSGDHVLPQINSIQFATYRQNSSSVLPKLKRLYQQALSLVFRFVFFHQKIYRTIWCDGLRDHLPHEIVGVQAHREFRFGQRRRREGGGGVDRWWQRPRAMWVVARDILASAVTAALKVEIKVRVYGGWR